MRRFQVGSSWWILPLVGWFVWQCSVPRGQCGEGRYPDPARFEEAIRRFEARDAAERPPRGAIVCTGSSSMRKWHTTIQTDLAPLPIIARGFGGSTMNDLLAFADRIIIPYEPRAVVIYEGDNDIAAGVSPEQVRDTFRALVAKIHRKLPNTRIYCLSIKPSVLRWKLWPQMQQANRLLAQECRRDERLTFVDVAAVMLDANGQVRRDIFERDMLHMNRKGYLLWRNVLRPILLEKEGGQNDHRSSPPEAHSVEPSPQSEARHR